MSKYKTFLFKDYSFEASTKTLRLLYGYDDDLEFTETFHFNFDFGDYHQVVLERACQDLFFMAGVSYYKAYLAPKIKILKGQMGIAASDFYSQTYQRGLGEFFYANQLDPHTKIVFPTNVVEQKSLIHQGNGQLIGLGGGKDSLLSVDILREQPQVATWSVGHYQQLQPLVERVGLPHYQINREWDSQLLTLNGQGAYNGHVPISAILAHVGTVLAVLTGYKDVVVSNEASANEPTLHYQGLDINHQYSKSLDFEKSYQKHLHASYGDSLGYYSLLRPLSELRIAELFSKTSFNKYQDVFSSCNKAYTHQSQQMFWCGQCPKCAFVFLALTPFVSREKLEALFGSRNLLLEPALEPIYKQLLGIEGEKPMECVGEIKESRAVMKMAQAIYPELSKYQFEIPTDYDYKALAAHSMPPDMYQLLLTFVK